MEVNTSGCKQFDLELMASRSVSVGGGGLYIRGLEIKGHICGRKLVELLIICRKSITYIFLFSTMGLRKTRTGDGILNKETKSS